MPTVPAPSDQGLIPPNTFIDISKIIRRVEAGFIPLALCMAFSRKTTHEIKMKKAAAGVESSVRARRGAA